MNNSASNKSMEDLDRLFGQVKHVKVPETLYAKIELKLSADKIISVPRKFVRLVAAAILLLITSETFLVVADMKSRKSVSSLVELPDNSLSYE